MRKTVILIMIEHESQSHDVWCTEKFLNKCEYVCHIIISEIKSESGSRQESVSVVVLALRLVLRTGLGLGLGRVLDNVQV